MIVECPLCPQKRTFSYGATSVALGQQETSLDYFVGSAKQGQRNCESKRFSRFEVDC